MLKQIVRRIHNHRPRRAVMYVPGDDKRKLKKPTTLESIDCVVFDCEDGVAMNRKDAARTTISMFLQTEKLSPKTDWSVRVNSVKSGLTEEDVRALYGSQKFPETIFLPKVESVDNLKFFQNIFQKYAKNTIKAPVDLFFYAESCQSVMDLPEICRAAKKLDSTLIRPAGIVFGSDDFCADLGASRTTDSQEIMYARQRVVLVAKAFKLQAIDMVQINLNDDEALRNQCREGAMLGYTGKQVIHPKQVPIVQEAFLPSARQIKWANELLEAYDKHQKSGKGAFVFENQMIDAPTMKQAKNIVTLIEAETKKQKPQ